MRTFLILFTLLTAFLCVNCGLAKLFRANHGVTFRIKVEAKDKNDKKIMEKALRVFQNRLDPIGNGSTAEVSLDPEKPNILNVKMFGDFDLKRVKKYLLYEADLHLKKVESPPNPNLAVYSTKQKAEIAINKRGNLKAIKYVERNQYSEQLLEQWIVVTEPSIVTGEDLRNASAFSATRKDYDYQINFSLKPDGAQKFGNWTEKNIGNYMAVVINDKAVSVAFIQSQIFDQGQISGNYRKDEAEDLASILRSGYLPAKLTFLSEEPFGDKPAI